MGVDRFFVTNVRRDLQGVLKDNAALVAQTDDEDLRAQAKKLDVALRQLNWGGVRKLGLLGEVIKFENLCNESDESIWVTGPENAES
ncbi:MAG: hypothetical protein US39_C0005G0024 [Microgenomates group bacterium GW2011_GWC1_37_12b]|nr:MAG: hypothetical protein US39_C0005G0024 [Microgenomates group bacterium GW2011_GWC1_37_12b]